MTDHTKHLILELAQTSRDRALVCCDNWIDEIQGLIKRIERRPSQREQLLMLQDRLQDAKKLKKQLS
jgi:hypothetical protein